MEKTIEFLRQGIHLLVIDLLPPTPRDPQGMHKAIWDEIEEEPFELPPDKPLTLAAYVAGDLFAGIETTAYVELIGVGDILPDMPAYLDRSGYVPVPLEATYQAAWATCPADLRELVETGEVVRRGRLKRLKSPRARTGSEVKSVRLAEIINARSAPNCRRGSCGVAS